MSPLLLLLLLLFHLHITNGEYPSYRIDCGGSATFTTPTANHTFLSDRYSSSGFPATVAEPHAFSQRQERTLRFFPQISSGRRNCYSVPSVPAGRYHVRVFVVYDNYDSKLRPPEFDVAVETTMVFSWRRPWPELAVRSGAYSDVFVFVIDGVADVCFYSISGDSPVVGSLEIVGVDPLCYDPGEMGHKIVLVNYGRLTCGSELFAGDGDRYGRIWQSDAGFRSSKVRTSSTTREIVKSDVSPDYFPSRLYQTAITAVSVDGLIEYLLPVDAEMDYVLWFHFAEIDPGVNEVGLRVFDIMIDRTNVTRIDVFKEVGSFVAFQWKYVVKNLTKMPLSVRLVSVVGTPMICGLENYAIVRMEPAAVPGQVIAMEALKESLQIPDRMGWNGDPCAPFSWDAWEGVTCHHSADGSHFVITQLDLGSQGLKGYISDHIQLLSNLVSLNLSSNSLQGTLPFGIGQKSLVQLDLSKNQLSGSIPDSLSSSSLKLVLLNSNNLEGQVPEKLYLVGVHGGAIDLSGNKGLCGVPSLPVCSFFSVQGKFSTRIKLAIGLSCTVILCLILLAVYVFRKRRKSGYDYITLQDLTLKRNRYQRQRSLMHIEMETQNSL